MEAGNEEFQKVWEEYLQNLAIAVDNLRIVFDCRVVLRICGKQHFPLYRQDPQAGSGKKYF